MSLLSRDTITRMLAALTYGEREEIIAVATTLNDEYRKTGYVKPVTYRRCYVYLKSTNTEHKFFGVYDSGRQSQLYVHEGDLIAVDETWRDNRLITVRMALVDPNTPSNTGIHGFVFLDSKQRTPQINEQWLTLSATEGFLDRIKNEWTAMQRVDPETLRSVGL